MCKRIPQSGSVEPPVKNSEWKTKLQCVAIKVLEVAKKVAKVGFYAFLAIASVALFLVNPTPFVVGVFVGFAAETWIRDKISRIGGIFIALPWLIPIAGIGYFLALPVAVASSSFLCGALVASEIASFVPEDYDPRTRIPQCIRDYFKPPQVTKPDLDV